MSFEDSKEPRHVLLTWGDFAKFILYGFIVGTAVGATIRHFYLEIGMVLANFHVANPWMFALYFVFLTITVWDYRRVRAKKKREQAARAKIERILEQAKGR